MRKFWTPERDAVIRSGRAAGDRLAVIAARLGATTTAVRSRAKKIGAVIDRTWTAAEDATLRELHPTHTAAAIGEPLGRGTSAVHRRMALLGLAKYPHWPAEVLGRVRALHAAGKCDREVVAAMPDVFRPHPLGGWQVGHIRKRLGLPRIPDRDAKRRSIENQRKAIGIRHGGDLRAFGHRKFALANGWPEALPVRAVQILNVLCERGPMTADAIAAAIAMPTHKKNSVHGGRRLLTCSALTRTCKGHGTYTGLLRAEGLVQYTHRAVAGRPEAKGGRVPGLYSVTAKAILIHKELLDEQRERNGGE